MDALSHRLVTRTIVWKPVLHKGVERSHRAEAGTWMLQSSYSLETNGIMVRTWML